MIWRDNHNKIPLDDVGMPRFRGSLTLLNDKGETLASICWFFDAGPFYAHAVDLNEPDVMRRIGPMTTLEAAKARCIAVVEGGIPDLDKRAGYPRR